MAGRPTLFNKDDKLSEIKFMLPVTIADQIQMVARDVGLSRTDYIRSLLIVSIKKVLETMDTKA